MTVSAAIGAEEQGSGKSGWANLTFLCLIGLLSSVHFQLIYLLLQPVKVELQLSDAELGIITGSAVAIIMAAAAFPIGWAADRFGRRLVLAASVLFWSSMTALCGLAYSFESFLAASAGLALGEAGIYGIMYAMIPDIVSERHRNAANSILLGVLVMSAASGLILGGSFLAFVQQLDLNGWSSWRVVFISAGLAGIPFAALAAAIRPLNPRRRQPINPAPTPASGFGAYLRAHGWTMAAVFVAINLFGSAWSLWMIWSPALYVRSFGADPAAAGQAIGWANMAGCVLALALANLLHRWTHERLRERFAIRILALGCGFALLPLLLLYVAATPAFFLMAFALEAACLVLAVSIAPMLLQDIAPARFRSRVAGLVAPIGLPIKVVTPFMAGAMSDDLGEGGLLLAVCLVSALCLALSVVGFALFEARYQSLVLSVREDDAPRAAGSIQPA